MPRQGAASLNRYRLASDAPGQATQRIVSPVFQDQSYRCGEAFSRGYLCATLPIGTWNLRTIRHEPLAVAFDDCRELVSHRPTIQREKRRPVAVLR